MVHVFPLNDEYKASFSKMFGEYYRELGCDDDCGHLIEEYILPDLLAGLIKADVLESDGKACGFVIWQRDDIENDWNMKEGWGDVREIYVAPDERGKGLGKFLLYTAEMKLRESGTNRAYCLPPPAAEGFFGACGYAPNGEYCDDLDCPVFVKEDLTNHCKGSSK